MWEVLSSVIIAVKVHIIKCGLSKGQLGHESISNGIFV